MPRRVSLPGASELFRPTQPVEEEAPPSGEQARGSGRVRHDEKITVYVSREELLALVDPSMDRGLRVSGSDGNPGVVLVVGVNGSGKTTTVGKIARILVAEDRTVTLGAADTFRAAAVDQLAFRANPKRVVEKTKQSLREKAMSPQGKIVLATAGGLLVLIVVRRVRANH